MSTKLSNNEIQKQLTKEEAERLKKETQKKLGKTVEK